MKLIDTYLLQNVLMSYISVRGPAIDFSSIEFVRHDNIDWQSVIDKFNIDYKEVIDYIEAQVKYEGCTLKEKIEQMVYAGFCVKNMIENILHRYDYKQMHNLKTKDDLAKESTEHKKQELDKFNELLKGLEQ